MNSKMVGFSKLISVICLVIFVVSSIVLCSFESNLNVSSQNIQEEINQLENDVETLTLHIQKSSSFAKIEEVAQRNGYAYRQNSATTAAVTTQE